MIRMSNREGGTEGKEYIMQGKTKTRRVLITGCGGDLGFALCKLFAETPNTIVIGTTRSSQLSKTKDRFKESELPKGKVYIEPLDFEPGKV